MVGWTLLILPSPPLRVLGLITFVLSLYNCLPIRQFVAFRWELLTFVLPEAVGIPQRFNLSQGVGPGACRLSSAGG